MELATEGPTGDISLPDGYEVRVDPVSKKPFFINHLTKGTTWIDPRDRLIKPATFADCVGDELPYGWEQAYDEAIGVYYINHIDATNQLEDPRQQWRLLQDAMIREYLATAKDNIAVKQDLLNVKQQRLTLAEEEYRSLHQNFERKQQKYGQLPPSESNMTLNSSQNSLYSKYDPDLIRSEIEMARKRVQKLKREEQQMQSELSYTQRGFETLAKIEQSMALKNSYTLSEAHAIMDELNKVNQSLMDGEKEKLTLIQSLAKLKEELQKNESSNTSLDISVLALPFEKLNMASQTELSGDCPSVGSRLAELARTRLQYDEARSTLNALQAQLMNIEEQIKPNQTELDRGQLLLIQEKENLLRELRSIRVPRKTTEIVALEQDIQVALNISRREMADRMKLHEQKDLICRQMADAALTVARLEHHLRSLSASTLSISSISTASSLNSLPSSGNVFELSNGAAPVPFSNVNGSFEAADMTRLQRKVERFFAQDGQKDVNNRRPRQAPYDTAQSTSTPALMTGNQGMRPMGFDGAVVQPSVSTDYLPPATTRSYRNELTSPPYYPPPTDFSVQLSSLGGAVESSFHQGYSPATNGSAAHFSNDFASGTHRFSDPQVDYFSSQQTPMLAQLAGESLLHNCSVAVRSNASVEENVAVTPQPSKEISSMSGSTSSTGFGFGAATNSGSVSTAVSDESVAGDSGVYDSQVDHHSGPVGAVVGVADAAQICLTMFYSLGQRVFEVIVERARNLNRLGFSFSAQSRVCVRGALLPGDNGVPCFSTKWSVETNNPQFDERFPLPVSLQQLSSKSVRLQIWCVQVSSNEEFCLGSAQISLADFNSSMSGKHWYNLLSEACLQSYLVGSTFNTPLDEALVKANGATKDHPASSRQRQKDLADAVAWKLSVVKEESSDESTVISSQTSTLTRNLECPESIKEVFREMENDSDDGDNGSSSSSSDGVVRRSSDTPTDNGAHGVTIFVQSPVKRNSLDNLEEETDEDEDVPIYDEYIPHQQELLEFADDNIRTTEVGTNTDGKYVGPLLHRSTAFRHSGQFASGETSVEKMDPTVNNNNVVKLEVNVEAEETASTSTTLRPVKLNRSDSDGSMPLYRRESFQRNVNERRSLRWKKPSGSVASGSARHHIEHSRTFKTSVDIEVDLHSAKLRLMQQQEELKRLREMKESLEGAQVRGDRTVPEWLAENDQLQELLTYSATGHTGVKLTSANDPQAAQMMERRRANRLIKKSAYEVKKLRQIQQRPSLADFRRKIGSLLGLSPRLSKLPIGADYYDSTPRRSIELTQPSDVSVISVGEDTLPSISTSATHPSEEETVTYQL